MTASAETKTCQICGRQIRAKNGVLAHHGYRRPGEGWQTASCEGARELPLEKSDSVLKSHIAAVARALEDSLAYAAASITMVVFQKRSYAAYQTKYTPFEVTAENFAQLKADDVFRSQSFHTFEKLVERERFQREMNARQLASYLNDQRVRYENNPFRPY